MSLFIWISGSHLAIETRKRMLGGFQSTTQRIYGLCFGKGSKEARLIITVWSEILTKWVPTGSRSAQATVLQCFPNFCKSDFKCGNNFKGRLELHQQLWFLLFLQQFKRKQGKVFVCQVPLIWFIEATVLLFLSHNTVLEKKWKCFVCRGEFSESIIEIFIFVHFYFLDQFQLNWRTSTGRKTYQYERGFKKYF